MASQSQQDCIIILDYGAPTTQLIAQRVREAGVYCEIVPYTISTERLAAFAPKGVILSAGPSYWEHDHPPTVPENVFDLGVPVLGIGCGMLAIAHHFGADVQVSYERALESGIVQVMGSAHLLRDLKDGEDRDGYPNLNVWMSYKDRVKNLPPDFEMIATHPRAPIAGFYHREKNIYGLQFHPHVVQTPKGRVILLRFITEICACATNWTAENLVTDLMAQVREQVGDERVLLALSGGVDSSVLAMLLHRAIGDQLVCVFVNTGLMRHDEAETLKQAFNEGMGMDVVTLDAAGRFMENLAGVTDPEVKRQKVGETFSAIFSDYADKLHDIGWFAQGTVYSDVVEATYQLGRKAEALKPANPDDSMITGLRFRILEPLRMLFKSEVRALGRALGMHEDRIVQHPFPGPGLAVRVAGEVTEARVNMLRKVDQIFLEEIKRHNIYESVNQAFAILLPVHSAAMMGEKRFYGPVVVLRAIINMDFMTAQWARLPKNFLSHVSSRILDEVPEVARVLYDISDKPRSTVEWE